MSTQVHTLIVDSEKATLWDAYVEKHPEGSFFHLSGWAKIVEMSFGHKAHFLYAEASDGTLVGVLPLVEQKSRLFGHVLISTPFCVYGGAIADDADILCTLEQAAASLGKQLAVDYIEFRYPFERLNNPDLVPNCQHSTYFHPLKEDDASILLSIKKKQRANVRQSLGKGLTHRFSQDVETAHRIYSESVRNLGTPVFPKQYFRDLIKVFPEHTDVLVVTHEDKPVSAVLNFYYKDVVMPYYGGGIQDARALKSNDYMYYQLMCHSKSERQCEWFDFGRSKNDSGSGHYKKTWGIEPKPLHYYVQLINAQALPNLSPNNPKYRFFINAWKKLPLSVSRFIGPFLSRFLG